MAIPNERLRPFERGTLQKDLVAGLVVFLVALPLCLGIALASGAPLVSGLIAGAIGGIVVGLISGSHTSVSGPAAGLTAIVATQIERLGTFEAFLTAVVLAGLMQLGLGIAKAGSIASFFPLSVIKGLLFAIGVVLILKQIPHLIGYDLDAAGRKIFLDEDGGGTFHALSESLVHFHTGAAVVGFTCLALLIFWEKLPALRKLPIPGPLAVVFVAVAMNALFIHFDSALGIGPAHLVQVPMLLSGFELSSFFAAPDLSALARPAVYTAAFTIAVVASLETLLNLEAVDRIDPKQRWSPPNRELVAQGAGNTLAGLIGGLPVTSVIVRSSVNINAGAQTKMSAVYHAVFLIASVAAIPAVLNLIPLSSLAAILIVTGAKLASVSTFLKIKSRGRRQFLPFIATVIAIVTIDLLYGIIIGLVVSVGFILASNFRRPLRKTLERHASGDVLRVQLGSQISFFNRPTIESLLYSIPRGGHILFDARSTDYIDPDILALINDFRLKSAAVRGVEMSFIGFKDHYQPLADTIRYVDHTTESIQRSKTPDEVLSLLQEGNRRFSDGQRIERDFLRQVRSTAPKQSPMAVVLSCIDSRNPVEIIFDLGIGDIFSVRVAGNIARDKIIGSMEYGCAVAGSKLIVVLAHTSCGAVTAAVDFFEEKKIASEETGCKHLDGLVEEIQLSIDKNARFPSKQDAVARRAFVDETARRNALRTMRRVREESEILSRLLDEGKIGIVGGLYDVSTGVVEFFDERGETISFRTSLSEVESIPA